MILVISGGVHGISNASANTLNETPKMDIFTISPIHNSDVFAYFSSEVIPPPGKLADQIIYKISQSINSRHLK